MSATWLRPGARVESSCLRPCSSHALVDESLGCEGLLQEAGEGGRTLDTWEACLALMATGQADLTPMVTHQLPLDEWQKGFELIESKEPMKVVLATGCADLGQKVRTSCVGYGKP